MSIHFILIRMRNTLTRAATPQVVISAVVAALSSMTHATELPQSSSGLAEFAQKANRSAQVTPSTQPNSPLSKTGSGQDAISSVIGTQRIDTSKLAPYQPASSINSTQAPASAQARPFVPAALTPNRDELERAVEQAFNSPSQTPELGGFKPTPQLVPTKPEQPANNPTTQATAESPKPAPAASTQPTRTYRVKPGDSLSRLAANSGMELVELAKLNSLNTNAMLRVGQTLRVPQNFTLAQAQLKQSSTQPKEPLSSYQVAAGDGLIALAKRFGMSTQELANLNNLPTTAQLRLGQTLQVPTANLPTQKPSSYRVQRGDTLIAVAARFGLTPSELARLNQIKPLSDLYVGQKLSLIAQADQAEQSKSANAPRSTLKNSTAQSYRVKPGEGLIMLAQRFGISTEELAKQNGLKTTAGLQVGQTLQIPSLTKDYAVQSGDGLIMLAKRFGTTTLELAELNGLDPDASLQLGQTLKVPAQ